MSHAATKNETQTPLKQQLDVALKENQALEKKNQALENENQALENEKQALENEKQALEKEKQAIEKENHILTAKVELFGYLYQPEKEDSKKDSKKNSKKELKRTKKDLQRTKKDLKRTREDLEEADEYIGELREKTDELKTEVYDAKSHNGYLKEARDDLKVEAQKLIDDLKRTREDLEEAQKRIVLERTREDLEEAQKRIVLENATSYDNVTERELQYAKMKCELKTMREDPFQYLIDEMLRSMDTKQLTTLHYFTVGPFKPKGERGLRGPPAELLALLVCKYLSSFFSTVKGNLTAKSFREFWAENKGNVIHETQEEWKRRVDSGMVEPHNKRRRVSGAPSNANRPCNPHILP